MLVIDLIIVALTLAAVVWGYLRGLSTSALALLGFGGGAILGSRVAPLVLDGGLRDPYAPVIALPAALLLGALFATILERVGFRLARRLRRFELVDGIGGALLAACLGLIFAWIAGAAIARIDSLEDPVRDSAILERLNAVIPPPGPLLKADAEVEDLPTVAGPAPGVPRADPDIVRDRDVKRAARSIIRIVGSACGKGVSGSGWPVRPGIVVTNAHVVAGERRTEVQARGEGPNHGATVIWFDDRNDIALLRAPDVRDVPTIPVSRRPKVGISGAIIGFPYGKFEINPARVGRTSTSYVSTTRRRARRRSITSFRGLARPGNSGGPMVDGRGRVVLTVFARRLDSVSGYGVPNRIVTDALETASKPVSTGPCRHG